MDTDVLDLLINKLASYPDLSFEREERSIFVEAPSPEGFSVWFGVSDEGYTVGFDAWHEAFEEREAALLLFALGFTEDARLKVLRVNGIPQRWTMETRQTGRWKVRSRIGKGFIPFWVKQETVVLQNPMAEKGAMQSPE